MREQKQKYCCLYDQDQRVWLTHEFLLQACHEKFVLCHEIFMNTIRFLDNLSTKKNKKETKKKKQQERKFLEVEGRKIENNNNSSNN